MEANNGKKQRRRTFSKGTAKRLIGYVFRQYPVQFILVLILIFISSLAGVGIFMFIEVLIDDYITPMLLEAAPVFTGLLQAIMVMAVISLIGMVCAFFYRRIMGVIAQGVIKTIRDDMFKHMQTLPIRYFDTHTYGEVMSYYTNDVDTLRQMLSQSIPMIFSAVISVVIVFFGMIFTSWTLTVFTLIMLAFLLQAVSKIASNSGKYFIEQQASISVMNGYIEEMIHGQKVVKVFCHEDKSKEKFDELNGELCKNATTANKYANVLMPIMGNLSNLQYVLIAILGGWLAINGIGGLTLGAITAFLHLSKNFTMPIAQVAQQLNMIYMSLAGAERIFKFLEEEPEYDGGYVSLVNAKHVGGGLTETEERTGLWAWKHPHTDGTLTYTELTGEVYFYDVDFGYNEDTIVLHNINMHAKQGQKIAFVGATGAGKTTITNLINRFYDLADGKVRYDGININKIKKGDLRRSLGIVLQDTFLFTGTVMENIRYGKLDATDEDVYKAAKLANAHSFISRLPDGYNTLIDGSGDNLSQGQRQLLSIARAAIADPPVMILDEATSSIDTRTEAIVQRGMDALMNGRTVFVIAHRLSTIKNSDVIMVLDKGVIIERGNHEQLIEQRGQYFDLYNGVLELE